MRPLFAILLTTVAIFASNVEVKLLSTVNSWNDAMNRKDYEAMSVLYAPALLYYGKMLPKSKVLADKRRALRKRPNYHQEIDDVVYDRVKKNIYKIFFNKYVKFTPKSKIKVYPSYLYVDTSSVIPKIIIESDRVTDLNILSK